MKKLLFLTLIFLQSWANAQTFGAFASAIQLQVYGNSTYYNLAGSGVTQIGTIPFSGDLGDFYRNSACLILKGAELKTWKNWGPIYVIWLI